MQLFHSFQVQDVLLRCQWDCSDLNFELLSFELVSVVFTGHIGRVEVAARYIMLALWDDMERM